MWCWMTAYSIRKNSSTLVMAEWGHSEIKLGEFKLIVGILKNPDLFYHVGMVSECKAETNCGPCKHKDAISKFLKIAEFSV